MYGSCTQQKDVQGCVLVKSCYQFDPCVKVSNNEHVVTFQHVYLAIYFFQSWIFQQFCNAVHSKENCGVLFGKDAVYKLMFGAACFYFLLMLLTIGVNSSKDCRAGVQNGFVISFSG